MGLVTTVVLVVVVTVAAVGVAGYLLDRLADTNGK